MAAPCRSGVPLARPFVRPFKLLRCCSRYCSCRGSKLLPAGSGKTADSHNTKNASFCTPPRLCAPRLCAHLPLVYRSVRTLRCCAVHCVEARPSHRRSIACAALRSLAGASRRAQDIRRQCATRRSAGLHSHAPSTHAQTRRGTVRGRVCEWVCQQDPQARARQMQDDHDAAPQLARREEEAGQAAQAQPNRTAPEATAGTERSWAADGMWLCTRTGSITASGSAGRWW